MGAWGERPYDNDTASDWLHEVLTTASDKIEELVNLPVDASNYDEYRAAAWLLTKICRTYVYDAEHIDDHLSKLHDRLQTIKNDIGYIATWKSPTEFVNDLDELIQQIQRVCKWNNVTVTF